MRPQFEVLPGEALKLVVAEPFWSRQWFAAPDMKPPRYFLDVLAISHYNSARSRTVHRSQLVIAVEEIRRESTSLLWRHDHF